jgi:hypothetical protein
MNVVSQGAGYVCAFGAGAAYVTIAGRRSQVATRNRKTKTENSYELFGAFPGQAAVHAPKFALIVILAPLM